jgi:Ca2+-binding RTX toxin-like protein
MHYRPTRRQARRALLAAALAVAALPAAAAQAADVTAVGTEIVVEDKTGPFGVGATANRLIAEALPGGELRLVDQVPLVSKTVTCVNMTPEELRCIRPSNSPISKLVFRAHGGNDQLRAGGSLPMAFVGGDGDDLYVGARTAAPTRVDFEGGLGDDLAHYTNATTGVDVSKDDAANDGRPAVGDRDNIRKDVDVVTGTHFADRFKGMVGLAGIEEFRPLGGDDVVVGADALATIVDMGAAKDGADRIVAGRFTQVSYAKRTNPVRVGVDLEGANDGETGEGDELVGVRVVIGGAGNDTLFAASRPGGIILDGGPGNDTATGTTQADRLTGGLGRDLLLGRGGNDTLIADEGDIDRVLCGDGLADVAFTDTAEEEISGCETRRSVGTLRLTPKVLRAEAGETARLALSWRHPTAWKQLRTIELRLTQDGVPVGEVTIRPRGKRIAAGGAIRLERGASKLRSKGKAVRARLAIRLADTLGGETVKVEVEATDVRGARQLVRAGAVRVAG